MASALLFLQSSLVLRVWAVLQFLLPLLAAHPLLESPELCPQPGFLASSWLFSSELHQWRCQVWMERSCQGFERERHSAFPALPLHPRLLHKKLHCLTCYQMSQCIPGKKEEEKRHCVNSGNKQNYLLVALDSSGNARYWFVVNSLVHFSPHHVSVNLSTESVNFTCQFNFFV